MGQLHLRTQLGPDSLRGSGLDFLTTSLNRCESPRLEPRHLGSIPSFPCFRTSLPRALGLCHPGGHRGKPGLASRMGCPCRQVVALRGRPRPRFPNSRVLLLVLSSSWPPLPRHQQLRTPGSDRTRCFGPPCLP